MKTEHLLLILGGAYLLLFRRPVVNPLGVGTGTNVPNTGGSGQPGQTQPTQGGQFFNDAADNAGGGTPDDGGTIWDKVTIGDLGKLAKQAGDFFGSLLS